MAIKSPGSRGRLCVFAATAVLLTGFGHAPAEESAEGALREELRDRDRIISDLTRRVEELERRTGAPARVAAPAVTRESDAAPPAPSGSATQAPGTVTVDELAAERALERTLTSEGLLLLPAGTFEIEPVAAYARRVITAPTLVAADGSIAARSSEVRRNEYDVAVRARVGLPFESQLELELPYRIVDQDVVRPQDLERFTSDSDTGSSIGDVKVGLAKTLFREEGLRPDLVARLTWDTDTGSREDSGVPLGIGYNELRASLTAVKRQDPLAFIGGLYYEKSFKRGDVEPGDEFGISIGTSLAVSPETALSLALAQTFSRETEIAGEEVVGSNQQSALLVVGASSLLSRQTLLSLTVGVGLTDDAPDYTVNLALPIRF